MGKWSREATSLLIQEVKKLPFLYDSRDKRYHDRRARRDAMHRIAILLSEVRPETTSEEVRMRWSALRSAFQASNAKMKRQINGTLGSEFTKVWFFDDMLFLCDILPSKNKLFYTASEGPDTIDVSTQSEGISHSAALVEETMDESPNEDHLREALPLENCSRNDVIGKNFGMENHHRENLQRENLPRENFHRENFPREYPQRETLEWENLQRDDNCVIEPLNDRGSIGDSRGCRKKRNHGIAFHHTLDYAMKRLADKPTEDADSVFGKFVTHELKSLHSPILKKKLKHKIMLNIIEVQSLQDQS